MKKIYKTKTEKDLFDGMPGNGKGGNGVHNTFI
jgi:hypothetical protein